MISELKHTKLTITVTRKDNEPYQDALREAVWIANELGMEVNFVTNNQIGNFAISPGADFAELANQYSDEKRNRY